MTQKHDKSAVKRTIRHVRCVYVDIMVITKTHNGLIYQNTLMWNQILLTQLIHKFNGYILIF